MVHTVVTLLAPCLSREDILRTILKFMKEGEEDAEDQGGWLVVDGAVISTVFKWECFQRGRCPSDSDSFDKCQGDSQGSQGGTHEGGEGGGV